MSEFLKILNLILNNVLKNCMSDTSARFRASIFLQRAISNVCLVYKISYCHARALPSGCIGFGQPFVYKIPYLRALGLAAALFSL